MEANIQQDFTNSIEVYFEHDISFNGYSYLIIYGKHINGCFIAIPNWEICCEASGRSNDVFFNVERLRQAGLKKETSKAIANYIKDAMAIIEDRDN